MKKFALEVTRHSKASQARSYYSSKKKWKNRSAKARSGAKTLPSCFSDNHFSAQVMEFLPQTFHLEVDHDAWQFPVWNHCWWGWRRVYHEKLFEETQETEKQNQKRTRDRKKRKNRLRSLLVDSKTQSEVRKTANILFTYDFVLSLRRARGGETETQWNKTFDSEEYLTRRVFRKRLGTKKWRVQLYFEGLQNNVLQ